MFSWFNKNKKSGNTAASSSASAISYSNRSYDATSSDTPSDTPDPKIPDIDLHVFALMVSELFERAGGDNPASKLEDCLKKLRKYHVVDTAAFVIGLQLLVRLQGTHEKQMLKDVDPYALCVVALMLGSKYTEDRSYNNPSWSRVSAIALSNLNELEVKMLGVLKFDLEDKSICQQVVVAYNDALSGQDPSNRPSPIKQ